MSDQLPPGAISLNDRLLHLEQNGREILTKIENLAKVDELREIDKRVDILERTSVSRSTVWGLIGGLVAQGVVIVGLALGLVYELLNHPHP